MVLGVGVGCREKIRGGVQREADESGGHSQVTDAVNQP